MVGERRALSCAVMAFYFLLFFVFAFSGLAPELSKALYALAGVYGLAFFALVAGYFWARWYSVGVGLFGVIVSIVMLWQARSIEDPYIKEAIIKQMLFFGSTHLVAALFLWGDAMSQGYDGQTAWRERFHMDDNAVQRLGRAVIRAGVSLPFVLMYAFVPRQDTGSVIASIVALCLTGLGVRALVKLKTWGVLALGAAGVLMAIMAATTLSTDGLQSAVLPGLSGVFLLAAAAPFSRSIARFVVAR